MTKRYSPSYCSKCARYESDHNIKPLELFETINGEYVLHTSHRVTVNLYNKTLKNYKAVKVHNRELIAENEALNNRIKELESKQL